MTRSTSINNAELRKMSTPIPISVNTWQMRSPHQFLSTEDSNQFDPGIMEQTAISQSSVSPSSAASYSFSPIAYINNNNKNNANTNPNNTTGDTNLINSSQHINPNLNSQQQQQQTANLSNIYINQPSQQQYQQHHPSNLTLNNINQSQPQQQHQQEPTMNVLNNPNNLMVNQSLNHFGYDSNNYPSVADLGGHGDLFGGDEERSFNQLIGDNDLFSGAGIYEDTHSSNVPLPVDLESLLINATLSDNSSQNMLMTSPMPNIDAQINSHHNHNQDDTSDEQTVSNNINPMFLFSKTNNVQQNQQPHHHQQQQQQQNHHQQQQHHQQNSTFHQANRVIKEEQEDSFNIDQVHHAQYFNSSTDQQGTIALSLPANSYLAQNYYARPSSTNSNGMNMNQQTGNNYNINNTNTSNTNSRSINQLLSENINRKINANNNGGSNNYSNQNQISDPVLTQAQLKTKQQQQGTNNNNNNNNKAQTNNQFNSNSNSSNNRTSPTNSGNSNNRKISYLLSQQNQQQQQQQQQMNMMSNNSHNFAQQQQQQQQQAMSLPGNMYYLQQHIKLEPQQPTEDDNDKFSKLKLSSPGSASTSSSSSSTASSSSSANNNTANIPTINNTVSSDLDSIINSTGLFNNDDVLSVLGNNNNNNNNNNPTSAVNNNANIQKASESDIFFKNMASLDACGDMNLPSDDQTVIEECLKFASDLEAEGLSRQQGRVRRRATVSFSKDGGEEEDENDYEDDYQDDEYEEEDDEEEDQANTPLQFSNADGRPGQSMGIAINRRQRSSRSFSGTTSKLSKSFSAQQNVTKRRQMNINQLCVGSVGSSSHLYNVMQQQQRGQMNSRKHARTSALSLLTSGVDVHSQSVGAGVQQMTSSDSKDMFSNIQFAPFSNNSHQHQQQQPQQTFQISPQQNQITSNNSNNSQGFLSSSLPVTTHFDSMMMVVNNKDNNTVSTNNHPNLNKLLLNNSQQQPASNLPVFSSSFGSSTGSKLIPASIGNKLSKKATNTKQKLTGSIGTLQTKKRQQRKQELFDDSDEDDDDDEEDDDDEDDEVTVGTRVARAKKSGQLISDLDEEEDESTEEEDDDSNDALNTTRSSIASSANHTISHSASSSFVNSESLFDLMMSSKSRDAYFWQYNVQSKGPKTKKVLTLRNKDPHLHRDFFDPVFQLQSLNARGGTAVNKLRKGDGNDVTPNPVKLYNLGNQIRDFIQKSYQMNNACFSPPPPNISSSSLNQLASTPVGSLGSNTNTNMGFLSSSVDTAVPKEKVNLKREKNKIASRACRLKKKAQHEANKIKLFGLNDEHKQLLDCISSARELIRTKLMEPHKFSGDKKMIDLMDDQINQKYKTKLAGNSDGYVHMLMLQVEKDRANNRKSGILDLNNLNKQYTLFQQHEKQVLQQQKQQQQQGQQIKIEQQSFDDQVGMDESTGGFMFNENTLSPQTPLQF